MTVWEGGYEPCPECDGLELDQKIQAWEMVNIDEDGNMNIIEQYDEIEVLEVQCANCGHQMFQA